jgi:molybdopterin converting factor small subunit
MHARDIEELMEALRARFGAGFDRVWNPRSKQIGEVIHVLVNGRNLALLEGSKTRLGDDDIVVVFEMLGGG